MIGLSGEKFTFFNSLGTTKFPEVSDFLFLLTLSFWQTFQNKLNYAFTSNIREVIKFYNLGDKTFETDFRYFHDGHLNVTWRGGAHFLSLHNLSRKNCILTPCFGIFGLQNNRKTIGKIAYCSWKQYPFVLEQIVITRFGISDQFLYPVQEFMLKMTPWRTARPV